MKNYIKAYLKYNEVILKPLNYYFFINDSKMTAFNLFYLNIFSQLPISYKYI